MTNEFDKIFGDISEAVSDAVTNKENQLDAEDILTEDSSVLPSEIPETNFPVQSTKTEYLKEIFEDESIIPPDSDEDFDPDAVYVKDEQGHFVKKQPNEEIEGEEELLDSELDELNEADELFDNDFIDKKKKKKKPTPKIAQKQKTPAPSQNIAKSITGNEEITENLLHIANENDSTSTEKENSAVSFENSPSDYDEEADKGYFAYKAPKSISEMSDEEIRNLSTAELSNLSPSEKKLLFERLEITKELEEREVFLGTKTSDEIRENTLIPQDTLNNGSSVPSEEVFKEDNNVNEVCQKGFSEPVSAKETTDLERYSDEVGVNNNEIVEIFSKQPFSETKDNDFAEKENEFGNNDRNNEIKTQKAENISQFDSFDDYPKHINSSKNNAENASSNDFFSEMPEKTDERKVSEVPFYDAEPSNKEKIVEKGTDKDIPLQTSSVQSFPNTKVKDTVLEEHKDQKAHDKIPFYPPLETNTKENNDLNNKNNSPQSSSVSEKSDFSPKFTENTQDETAKGEDTASKISHFPQKKTENKVISTEERATTDTIPDFNTEKSSLSGSYNTSRPSYTEKPAENTVLDKVNYAEYFKNQSFSKVEGENATNKVETKTLSEAVKSGTVNSQMPHIPLSPPQKVSSWTPEKITESLSVKYGKINVSPAENNGIILSFSSEDKETTFSVTLDKAHNPINVNNPPDNIKDILTDIYRENQSIALNDNLEYIKQKTLYEDSVTKTAESNMQLNYMDGATVIGFNPNGYTKKIGNGYNLSIEKFSPTSPAPAFTGSFGNPHISKTLHPSVLAGYYASFNIINQTPIPATPESASYIKDIYSNFVEFKNQLEKDSTYTDKSFSEPKMYQYGPDMEVRDFKPVPFPRSSTVFPQPFINSNVNDTASKSSQTQKNIQTYSSAINPVYNISNFSQYNFFRESQNVLRRSAQITTRPLLNTVRSTAFSTEIGGGARKITGYIGAPVMIGAVAAVQNIWVYANQKELLSRTSEQARYIVTERIRSAGISFKRSALNSPAQLRIIQSRLIAAGKGVGIKEFRRMNYVDLKNLQNRLKSQILTVDGKQIDFASAKSIVRHLKEKSPTVLQKWVEQNRLVSAAIVLKEYSDGFSVSLIQEIKTLGLIKSGEKFDLTNLRDIQILKARLVRYADNKGYGSFMNMSQRAIRKWLIANPEHDGRPIVEMLQSLGMFEKQAKRISNLKFSRLFSVLQLLQTVMNQNDIVQGGMMIFRTIHSAIMATKATIRLTKTTYRFFSAAKRRAVRTARRLHLDAPVKAVSSAMKKTQLGKTATKATASLKKTRFGHNVVSLKKKVPLAKEGFRKFATAKPKILNSVAQKIGSSQVGMSIKAVFQSVSSAFGEIFLGAAIGIAALLLFTICVVVIGKTISTVGETASFFFEGLDSNDQSQEFQKLYDDLAAQDKSFYDDIKNTGQTENYGKSLIGYYSLADFNKNTGTFNRNPMTAPGDDSAPEGSLNKLGYEYHLYDRMFTENQKPSDVGAKEISFESNAKQIISCGSTIFYSDSTAKNYVLADGSSVKASTLLREYCIDGGHFEDASGNKISLWTATHQKFVSPSSRYTCANGCATYTFHCNKYAPVIKNYIHQSTTPNNEILALYNLKNDYEFRACSGTEALNNTENFGCKKHTEKSGNKVEYVYYCGLTHESNGKYYKCCAENKNKKNIGHTLSFDKIKSCNEQAFVFTNQTVTQNNDHTCGAKPTNHNTKIRETVNKMSSANLDGKLEFLENNENLIVSFTPNVFSSSVSDSVSKIKNGFTSTDANGNTVEIKGLSSVCPNLQTKEVTASLGNVYLFYCPAHSTCGHGMTNYSITATTHDAKGTGHTFITTISLYASSCTSKVSTPTKVTLNLPSKLVCLGYCDVNHEIHYCTGHYNNIVNAYIVSSMDNEFSCTCTNPSCENYGKKIEHCTDNECTGRVKDSSGVLTNEKCKRRNTINDYSKSSIFYADMLYGPSKCNILSRWGNANNGVSYYGWFQTTRGASRMLLATSKSRTDWNYMYGISVPTGNQIAPSEMQNLITQSGINSMPECNEKTLRREIIVTAMKSVSKVPFYKGGVAICADYDSNNFGSVTTPDFRGRTLKGLDNIAWIKWVYVTSFEHAELPKPNWLILNNSIGSFDGSNLWMDIDSSHLPKAGDTVKIGNEYGIYIAAVKNEKGKIQNHCIAFETGEPTDNVTLRYISTHDLKDGIYMSYGAVGG